MVTKEVFRTMAESEESLSEALVDKCLSSAV